MNYDTDPVLERAFQAEFRYAFALGASFGVGGACAVMAVILWVVR